MDSRDGLSLITGLECGMDRWTGSLDWIAGVDCWTGFSKESCQASQDCMCSGDFCLASSYGRSSALEMRWHAGSP